MRVLVTGWFSFLHGEATAGDLLAMEVATDWLTDAGIPHDVACSPVLGGGVELEAAAPASYSDVLFVCGPAAGEQLEWLRERFRECRLTLLDVSVIDDARADLVFERDSDRAARPDLAIAAASSPAPLVAVVRGHSQPEYGQRDRHADAMAVIDGVLGRHRFAVVEVDTRVGPDDPTKRDPSQVEGLLARADAAVTARLHGLVLALKHGVPAVAIDPIAGGGKVSAQAAALDWPLVLTLDEATEEAVDAAVRRCLDPSSRALAARCRQRAVERVGALGREVVAALTNRALGESA